METNKYVVRDSRLLWLGEQETSLPSVEDPYTLSTKKVRRESGSPGTDDTVPSLRCKDLRR